MIHQHSQARVGLIGAGTVGASLLQLLARYPHLEITGVVVQSLDKERPEHVMRAPLTTDAESVIDASDVVVELAGGTGEAYMWIQKALSAGKRVVTANKAALAQHWDDLEPYIREGRLYFEASVMAGVPVLASANMLRGNRPSEIHAALNGTCAMILMLMGQGQSFIDAVSAAQSRGFAEADPSLDTNGIDAAHKLTILGRMLVDPDFRFEVVLDRTHGLHRVEQDIVFAHTQGGERAQLVGSIMEIEGEWQPIVRPVLLRPSDPIFVGDPLDGVFAYIGDEGTVVMHGAGAGGPETASGVLSDLLLATQGARGPVPLYERVEPRNAERPKYILPSLV